VARFTSAAEFLWRQVANSVLTGPVGALNDMQRCALADELVDDPRRVPRITSTSWRPASPRP
jgi:hypothetical protein